MIFTTFNKALTISIPVQFTIKRFNPTINEFEDLFVYDIKKYTPIRVVAYREYWFIDGETIFVRVFRANCKEEYAKK